MVSTDEDEAFAAQGLKLVEKCTREDINWRIVDGGRDYYSICSKQRSQSELYILHAKLGEPDLSLIATTKAALAPDYGRMPVGISRDVPLYKPCQPYYQHNRSLAIFRCMPE